MIGRNGVKKVLKSKQTKKLDIDEEKIPEINALSDLE